MLGAVQDGVITPAGRRMAELGAHPRLAAMMLSAADPAQAALAADLAALLEERDPMRERDAPADVALRLEALAGRRDADRGALARIRQAAAQYRRRLRTTAPAAGDPAPLLAAAFPRPDRATAERGRVVPPVRRRRRQVAAHRPARPRPAARGRGLGAGRLGPHPARRPARPGGPAGFTHCRDGRERLRRRLRQRAVTAASAVWRLVLEDRTVPADAGDTARVLADVIGRKLDALDWTDAARQMQARAALLRTVDPGVPDLSDAALAAEVQTWLAPHLLGRAKLADARALDLPALLRARLGWAHAAQLDRDLPTHLTLPGGRAAIDYLAGGAGRSGAGAGFLWTAHHPHAAGGPNRAALRPAIARGPAGGDHRRLGRVLVGRLVGHAAGDARALSEARLAGAPGITPCRPARETPPSAQ